MMLVALRLLLGTGLVYCLWKAWENAQAAPVSGDLTNAFWLAVSLGFAVANGAAWAPFFGARISEPLTGVLTEGTHVDHRNRLLRLIRWLEVRRCRALTLVLAFLEGIRHPGLPTAFVIGLRNARQGSWLEKVFAGEVFRFDNVQHSVEAYRILRRHGIDPRPHRDPGIDRVLRALEREVRPEPAALPLRPAQEPAAVQRNPEIRLFAGAERFGSPSQTEPGSPTARGDTG